MFPLSVMAYGRLSTLVSATTFGHKPRVHLLRRAET